MTNQYEVPFAHLNGQFGQQQQPGQFGQQQQPGQFGPYNGQQFLRPAALPYPYRAVPTGQSSAGSAYSRSLQQQQQQQAAGQQQYPYRHHQQQYLSDYESQ